MKPIILFEWTYRKNRPAGYVYAGLIGLVAFFMVAGGSFSGPEQVNLFSGTMLSGIFSAFSLIMLFIASAIMGPAIYRDLEHNMTDTIFALPLTPKQYFWSRFVGGFGYLLAISLVLCLAIWLGALLAPTLGLAEKLNFGEVSLLPIFSHWASYMVPNLYMASALFFSLMVIFRRSAVVFFGAFAVFVLYTGSEIFIDKLDKELIGAMLDPLGMRAYTYETRFWTPEEMNRSSVFFSGYVLWNRLLWLGLATALLLFTYFLFSFSRFRAPVSRPVGMTDLESLAAIAPTWTPRPIRGGEYILSSMRIYLRQILREPLFYIMILLSLGLSLLVMVMGSDIWETPSYPLTYNVLQALTGGSFLFLMILLVIYAGELIHRDRELRFDLIADSLPHQNAWSLLAKWLTLVVITAILILILFLSGVAWQLAHGFTDLRLDFYGGKLLSYFLTLNASLMACFALHSLVRNKLVGHFLCIGYLLLPMLLRLTTKFSHHLLYPGSGPSFLLSDLAGYVPVFWPTLIFDVYWLLFGGILLMVAYLFWPRGLGYSSRARMRLAGRRLADRHTRLLAAGSMLSFLGLGLLLFNHTNILNDFVTRKRSVADLAYYEKEFKYLEHHPKPRFVHARMELDLYPERRAFDIRFQGRVVNDDLLPIDTLIIVDEPGQFSLRWNGNELEPVFSSKSMFMNGQKTVLYKYVLPDAFVSGDTAEVIYTSGSSVKGMPHNDFDFNVLANGSFLNFSLSKIFGYNKDMELEGEKDRKKHGLIAKDQRLPAPDDARGRSRNLFGNYGMITLESVISTVPGQIAVVPGYLEKQWNQDGRSYWHYRMDDPMVDFFNVCSARYALHEDSWTGPDGQEVRIQLFHHPGHDYNLGSFVLGIRDALDYYTVHFGPYPHRHVRILEFPRYNTYAQSFSQTIPFAESFGWVADLRDSLHFDYPYYVTAHEMAHQWWGHQVVPAEVQGGNLLSESLSEYSAIMVAEKRFGRQHVGRFLRENLNEYLEGRGNDRFPETPYISSQASYQDYKKGAVVFYAMRHYIGEEWVNKHLREFLALNKDKLEGPYPAGIDLYKQMRLDCPDSLVYLMEDFWEHLCTYELEVREATAADVGNETWEVKLQLKANKQYIDGSGKKMDPVHPMHDLLEIVIFGEPCGDRTRTEELPILYREMHRLGEGDTTLTITVNTLPFKAGIDPYSILIDRKPDNNVTLIRTK